jgi:lysophospholipase L1-like esterase
MRKLISSCCFLFFFLQGSMFAQEPYYPPAPEDIPFLNLEANRIILPDSFQEKFVQLNEKMYSMRTFKTGTIHFLQLGDSHIQADFLTGRVRDEIGQLLQCSLAGRGLVFPYRFAKTNNPENYRFSSTNNWDTDRSVNRASEGTAALAGVSVYTRDTLIRFSLKLLDKTAPVTPFSHLDLYYSFPFPIRATEATGLLQDSLVDSGTGIRCLKLLFNQLKDSVYITIHLPAGTNAPFYFHGLFLANGHPGIIYSALGSNGASAESYLRSTHLLDQLALVKPDVLIISLGTNDAFERPFYLDRFRTQYDSLLGLIEGAFPDLPVVLTTPGDSWHRDHKTNMKVNVVREEILGLAAKHSCAVWDLYAVMGGNNVMNKWYTAGLARKDRLHFSKNGYALLGDLLGNAWAGFYNSKYPE